MMTKVIRIDATTAIPLNELEFRFSRSAGPGGQNVNKVSTRVEVLFDVVRSPNLDADQKHRVVVALKSRISENGVLRVLAQESRSQWRNREVVLERFASLLRQALSKRQRRIPTKPSRTARSRKTQAKKLHSQKKALRRRVEPEGSIR
jgi:ribosome-associated protein